MIIVLHLIKIKGRGKKYMINKYLIINVLQNTGNTDLADNHG
jgi:hypothetical protein